MKNCLMKVFLAGFFCLICINSAQSEWKIYDHKEAGDPQAGKAKAELCIACHGLDGNSINPAWPKLAGQNRKYLFRQLKAFKAGEKGGRNDPIMVPLVLSLSEEDMWDIAAYYESLTTSIGKVKPAYLTLGQRIYRGGNLQTHVAACIACHGPHGLGNALAGFPRLSGQHPAYIIDQLKGYKNSARNNELSNIMQTIAAKMTEAEIIAVSHYITGLH